MEKRLCKIYAVILLVKENQEKSFDKLRYDELMYFKMTLPYTLRVIKLYQVTTTLCLMCLIPLQGT